MFNTRRPSARTPRNRWLRKKTRIVIRVKTWGRGPGGRGRGSPGGRRGELPTAGRGPGWGRSSGGGSRRWGMLYPDGDTSRFNKFLRLWPILYKSLQMKTLKVWFSLPWPLVFLKGLWQAEGTSSKQPRNQLQETDDSSGEERLRMWYNTRSVFQAIDYIRELNHQIEALNTTLHNAQSDQWWLQLFNNFSVSEDHDCQIKWNLKVWSPISVICGKSLTAQGMVQKKNFGWNFNPDS